MPHFLNKTGLKRAPSLLCNWTVAQKCACALNHAIEIARRRAVIRVRPDMCMTNFEDKVCA